ncbi:protein FAM228B-like [Anneissia japonica]|uniref:protein FAM228B-like n=1 Tax=Anneissia japonica TaxID=1529436 RepID=UPI00142553CB|nr:protein FAM228B-like [Anneissia japonica]
MYKERSFIKEPENVGCITVHAPILRKELSRYTTCDDQSSGIQVRKKNSYVEMTRRPWSSPNPSRSNMTLSAASRSTIDQGGKIQNWLSEKAVKGIQQNADLESLETRSLYNPILHRENTFVRDVDNFLLNKSYLDNRKKEVLYKKWQERVSEPIEEQKQNAVKVGYAEVDSRKRKLFEEYLAHTNKKGHVFLDTFDQREYDPLSLCHPRPAPLVAKTKRLSDPLLMQEQNRNEEGRIIFGCTSGERLSDREIEQYRLPPLPLVPLGRHGTECRTWLAMPLTDIESPVRRQSRRRMHGTFNDLHFDVRGWAAGNHNGKLVDDEMNIQKRRRFLQFHPAIGTASLGHSSSQTEQEAAS